MDPFVHDYARNGLSHHVVAQIVIHGLRIISKHVADAAAIDVDEGLDVPVAAQYPAQRSLGDRLARPAKERAIAMKVNGDRRLDFDAGDKSFAAN